MIILNFSHPLTAAQLSQIESLTETKVEEVRGEMAKFDNGLPFAEQVRSLVERVGLSSEQWQGVPLLVNPPGYAPAALTLLAELHGRMGYFPAMMRLRPVAGAIPPRYEVAELLNLQGVRESARDLR
jgi:hypothetical protein